MNSPAVTVPNDKDLDFYHIKLDMSKDGTNRTASSPFGARFLSQTKRGGGLAVVGSQNVQFETITPNIQTMTPPGHKYWRSCKNCISNKC